jgi:predicted MFS family arabinose efflux permease
MARDLGISIAEAGRFVTGFAFASAIGGPLLTIVASMAEPRRALILALLAFALGNLVAALAPSHAVIVAVRMVQGAALPVFVSIGNAAAAGLAGEGREGRAIATVNVGVVIGIVLAIPAGVVLADRSGWPASFAVLAILALIAALIVGAIFPRLESARASMKAQAIILWETAFQAHLLLSAILFTAMFAAYTYLAAFLESVAGFNGECIAFALMGFGIAGWLGNWVAGRAVGRGPTAATAGIALALMLTTASVSLAAGNLILLLPLLGFWGAAHTAAFVACQVRVMLAGTSAPAFASSLNISACNLGIALGATAGGWLVERYGIAAIGFGSAALALCALILAVLMAGRSAHRRPVASKTRP